MTNLNNSIAIKLLQRYRIDRAPGATADGPTQLVVLILKAAGEPDRAFAISKADAMIIASQLQLAAADAQDHMLGGS